MRTVHSRSSSAFTIVEVMIALFLFSMVLTAIYSTWIAILRGKKVALEAAAEVQRSRRAIRTIEDALLTAQFFPTQRPRHQPGAESMSPFYYAFEADTAGEMASLTLVSRLPEDFLGVGRYGDQVVRRVSFGVEPGAHGNELVMTQYPMLMDLESGFKPYTVTLARDVTEFSLQFYDFDLAEWSDEWLYTNRLPVLVNVTLGQGKRGTDSRSHDVASRIISVPASMVMPGGTAPGMGAGAPPQSLGIPK